MMADQLPTAYERLGVLPEASASEITSAYRRLLRRHHPDSREASRGLDRDDHAAGEDAAEALGPIIEAYAVLRDPGRRADYDRRQEALKPPTITYSARRQPRLSPARRTCALAAGAHLVSQVQTADRHRAMRRWSSYCRSCAAAGSTDKHRRRGDRRRLTGPRSRWPWPLSG